MLLPLTVHTDDGSYTQGDVFEKEFTAEDEATNLDSGLLELVPAAYLVVGDSHVHDTPPGGVFTAALRIGHEELLVAGGHIERVEEPLPTPTARATRKKEK